MKKLVAAALLTAMISSLASCGKNASAVDTEYIYGKIDSVSGNDIVLLLADYNEDADASETKDKKSSDSETDDSKSERKKPSRSEDGDGSGSFKKPEKGEMPEDFDPEQFKGKMPGGFSKSDDDDSDGEGSKSFKKPEKGEMPEGFDPENFSGEMPDGFDPEKFSGEKQKSGSRSKSREGSGSSTYTLTGEQEELRIPVGTTVTTSLGVKTDFDALSAGDIIKCSIEKGSDGKEVVTEVWIMEQ